LQFEVTGFVATTHSPSTHVSGSAQHWLPQAVCPLGQFCTHCPPFAAWRFWHVWFPLQQTAPQARLPLQQTLLMQYSAWRTLAEGKSAGVLDAIHARHLRRRFAGKPAERRRSEAVDKCGE
jgi:hypothetical protein